MSVCRLRIRSQRHGRMHAAASMFVFAHSSSPPIPHSKYFMLINVRFSRFVWFPVGNVGTFGSHPVKHTHTHTNELALNQHSHNPSHSTINDPSTVPIGLSRIQVVPQSAAPKIQTKLGEAQILRATGQKNNNNKSLGTATITTTTSSPGGHIVKGKRKKVNILLEHNYA